MKKSHVAVLIGLVLLGSAVAYWWLNRDKDDAQHIVLYGNVDIRQVSLAFETAGRIKNMTVQEGDRVKKGQVLAHLNTESLSIQAQQADAQLQVQQQTLNEQAAGNRPEEIAQAKAQVGSAKAQLENADKQYQRLAVLNNSSLGQAVSKQEVDAAKSTMKTAEAALRESEANLQLLLKGVRKEDREAAKAQYESTKASLDLIKYQIAQSELRSPVDGVVRARLQEVGDMTTSSKSVYTIALTDPKWVRVYASETELGQIKMGSTATILRDSQPDQPITGKIGYISSVAEFTPKTVQTEDIRTTLVYEVRIYVNDPNDQLKMGQPVTVNIDKSSKAKTSE
ncbi:HlyD family efflux transporter periplasmic adaptor subunit [Acinetobacter johnsonii]|jgi:HlyD family secretion protein|uniref:HlyD family efflux transporter periplasmic adaptor subunit n=1 Tax=Acinetobacter johnsonii TaxID=40214 RepID=UPI00244B8623|nr:HlyD family efflux transporter periplasmic adaptor subunit [Acinetobacter johnsonii]MDH1699722.1 HlyD family efflux transporter periplasmic adaptor subunit [Acinetobacter johnsonii]